MHTITLLKLTPGELFYYKSGTKKYLLFRSRVEKSGKILCFDNRLKPFSLPNTTLVRVRKTVGISQAQQHQATQSLN